MIFFVEPSWSERWRTGECQCPEEIIPGLEQEVSCDRAQALEEPLSGHQFPSRRAPGPVPQFTDGMTGEGQQIEDREHGRQMLLPVTEVMLQVVSLGFQNIEALVFNLPSGPAAGGEFGDIVSVDIQVSDEAVTIGHFPAGITDLDH